jgi:hypothetical protein
MTWKEKEGKRINSKKGMDLKKIKQKRKRKCGNVLIYNKNTI